MELLVLSARPDTQSNARLLEAAVGAGVGCRLIDATRVVASTDQRLLLGDDDLLEPRPDAIIVRVGNWRPSSLLSLLEVATTCGVATPNPPAAIRIGRDHWQTVMTLSAAGVPVPRSMVGADPEALATAAGALGLPVVVKQRRSRMGVGVIRCSTADHLEAVLDSLWRLGDEVMVQRFADAGGSSRRLMMVGERLIAAACFDPAPGEWRSNAARGGVVNAYEPTPREIEIALAAARAVGLGVCGVDVLMTNTGPVVCEVNPTPGFVSLERATGVDVAKAIIDFASSVES
jgi:RimK family alpha-L-glutamate ligase